MTDAVICYLDWVVAYQGRIECWSVHPDLGQDDLLATVAISTSNYEFKKPDKMSNARGCLGRWSNLLACLLSLYNVPADRLLKEQAYNDAATEN